MTLGSVNAAFFDALRCRLSGRRCTWSSNNSRMPVAIHGGPSGAGVSYVTVAIVFPMMRSWPPAPLLYADVCCPVIRRTSIRGYLHACEVNSIRLPTVARQESRTTALAAAEQVEDHPNRRLVVEIGSTFGYNSSTFCKSCRSSVDSSAPCGRPHAGRHWDRQVRVNIYTSPV